MMTTTQVCLVLLICNVNNVWGEGWLRRGGPQLEAAPPLESASSSRRRPRQKTNYIAKFLSRHLKERTRPTTVSEFCGDLSSLEEFLIDEYISLFAEAEAPTSLSESGNFLCACEVADQAFRLKCGIMISWHNDTHVANDLAVAPQVNWEVVDFVVSSGQEETTSYVPSQLTWCNSDEFFHYCEEVQLNSTNPGEVLSCSVTDASCEGAVTCEVCPGGQGYVVANPCFPTHSSTQCEAVDSVAFLYNDNLLKNMTTIVVDPAPATVGCSEQAPVVEDFCQDLSSVEANLTSSFLEYFSLMDLSLVNNQGYNCTCIRGDGSSTLTMRCEAFYFENSLPDIVRLDSTDMIFAPSPQDTNILLPSRVFWSDQPVAGAGGILSASNLYFESYELAMGQDKIYSCNINGCKADFCELCGNGMAVATNCFSGTTCPTFLTGSFLLAYRHTRLAIKACPFAQQYVAVERSGLP